MVLSYTTKHVYPYEWDVVTRAFWNKYPNDKMAHVESVDVLNRYIDENGILHTARLTRVSQDNLPSWVKRIMGSSAFAYEETSCDPVKKTLKLRSRNISFNNLATVEENCVYSVEERSKSTKYEQTTSVTAFVPFVARKLERFSVRAGEVSAGMGLKAMEDICENIFEGKFPPAFCEALNLPKRYSRRSTKSLDKDRKKSDSKDDK